MVERSAGIIFFRIDTLGRKYLVLRSSRNSDRNKKEFWDFPKGLLEKGEQGIDAARREASEETGIKDFETKNDFKQTVRYFTRHENKTALKFVAMFLAEVKTDMVRLSWEHDKYEWLTYQQAYERISRVEMKKALAAAEEFLEGV